MQRRAVRREAVIAPHWVDDEASAAPDEDVFAGVARGAPHDEVLSRRFFLYDDPELYMAGLRDGCHDKYGVYDPDVAFVEAARRHPMRTWRAEEAASFVVPIPAGTSWQCDRLVNGTTSAHNARMRDALRRLVATDVWRSTRGRDHVWLIFYHQVAVDYSKPLVPDDVERGEWASRKTLLSNMTLLTFEKVAVQYAWACVVVVPYLPSGVVEAPSAPAAWPTTTFEEWLGRETLLFYRSPETKQWYDGATEIRRRPWALAGLPNVTVGGAVDKAEHLAEMARSKFCLVVRGDTATSHKMFDALHALCVPVLLSDHWDAVGKPFPEFVPWDDLLLRIPEREFMSDPHVALDAARRMDPGRLRAMFAAMVAARGALDWRAPRSQAASYSLETVARECHGRPGLAGV